MRGTYVWSALSMESFRQHKNREETAQHGHNLRILSFMHILTIIKLKGD
jgi:hypothetical protein